MKIFLLTVFFASTIAISGQDSGSHVGIIAQGCAQGITGGTFSSSLSDCEITQILAAINQGDKTVLIDGIIHEVIKVDNGYNLVDRQGGTIKIIFNDVM